MGVVQTVSYGKLDALLGVTFNGYGLTYASASLVDGSITTIAASPNQVLTYVGITQTIGQRLIPQSLISYTIVGISDTNNTITVDAYIGKSLVAELDFWVAGFGPTGIALATMSLDSLVTQAGNLPGLDGSLFVLGTNPTGASGTSLTYSITDPYAFMPNATVLYATAAKPVLTGTHGQQMLIALSGNDTITAGLDKTIIYGGPGNDTINLGPGADLVYAGNGNDVIHGGTGNATIYPQGGNDTIYAGSGRTIIAAGTGKDVFVFSPGHIGGLTATTADVVQHFRAAKGQVIDLSAFDAQLPAGTTNLSFIGAAAFDNQPGEVRYAPFGNGIALYGDINGDGTADFMLILTKITSIAAGNLIL